ncbi:MAG: hypothetical protein GXY48_11505 [Methanomicrobiales archaeon]|nr:hypothetical protein [Methanomicrobiales archaeon]
MPIDDSVDVSGIFLPHTHAVYNLEIHAQNSDIKLLSAGVIEEMIPGLKKTSIAWDLLLKSTQIQPMWNIARYITTEKLRMNDYGRNHAIVTAASAMQIMNLLLIRLFILSAIHSHHGDPALLTVEGSVVSIADALDMTKGRTSHSRDITTASIHAISTLSIDEV